MTNGGLGGRRVGDFAGWSVNMASTAAGVKARVASNEHAIATYQHRRRRLTLATHRFRDQAFLDIRSYEVSPGGVYLPRSADRITVAAALVPQLLEGIAKAKRLLERDGLL